MSTEHKGNKADRSYDCTDCKHYAICYLRRHRSNPEDVTPCKDIELDQLMVRSRNIELDESMTRND